MGAALSDCATSSVNSTVVEVQQCVVQNGVERWRWVELVLVLGLVQPSPLPLRQRQPLLAARAVPHCRRGGLASTAQHPLQQSAPQAAQREAEQQQQQQQQQQSPHAASKLAFEAAGAMATLRWATSPHQRETVAAMATTVDMFRTPPCVASKTGSRVHAAAPVPVAAAVTHRAAGLATATTTATKTTQAAA